MTEIVNLNRARKQRAKASKEKTAEANRIEHGTPKALRKLDTARRAKAAQDLAGHRLENPDDDNKGVGENQSGQN